LSLFLHEIKNLSWLRFWSLPKKEVCQNAENYIDDRLLSTTIGTESPMTRAWLPGEFTLIDEALESVEFV
jgi:hypothetical protein